MKEIILLKDGEIALKGLNRHAFEDRLIKNARRVPARIRAESPAPKFCATKVEYALPKSCTGR